MEHLQFGESHWRKWVSDDATGSRVVRLRRSGRSGSKRPDGFYCMVPRIRRRVDRCRRDAGGLRESLLPIRARMTAASFLSCNLELDWREGGRHVFEHLVEREIALNNLNWQWMAGRGTGTNPDSVLCMTRQGPSSTLTASSVRRAGAARTRLGHGPRAVTPQEPRLVRRVYQAPIVPLGDMVA
jgi:hypothetical protein